MTINQLEKLKKLASSEQTPESIRKELIDVLTDREIITGGVYYQSPMPVRPIIDWEYKPWNETTYTDTGTFTVTAGVGSCVYGPK